MGSSIGGAIGGAISTIFASKLVTAPIIGALSTGIGSALGLAAGVVIPVIGSIIGALIGRLFSRTPKASATGQLTESGFTTVSMSERKVASGTAQNLADIAGTSLTSVVDQLKTIGIEFKDVLTTTIGLRKSSITGASLTYEGGASFSRGGSGTSQSDIQDIAEFYIDSFVKGLRKGSLVVDSTVQAASELQAAIDKFVTEDSSTKTLDRLQYVLEYAAGFSKILEDLGEAVPVTMEDAIAQITEGSKAAASAIAQQYADLKADAADVFGTASSQYEQLGSKIKDNALAQLGLAKGSDGVLRSISEATSELNAGYLAIANIIQGISSFNTALAAAGFSASEAANIIDFSLLALLSFNS
jgi:hypothetical protein